MRPLMRRRGGPSRGPIIQWASARPLPHLASSGVVVVKERRYDVMYIKVAGGSQVVGF